MEDFFSDPTVNQKANNIVDIIEKTARPMASPSYSMMSLNNTGLRIAEDLINSCLSDLKDIKQKVGSNDENYLEISSALAVTASGIVKIPVAAISLLAAAQDFHADKQSVARSKSDLAEATRLTSVISSFDLTSRARQTIAQKLEILNTAEQRVNKTSGGCYIATSVYGSYNSREVLVLRSFRDNQLMNRTLGRAFTSVYYSISPFLVNFFGGNSFFIGISRTVLNSLVRLLS